MQPCGGTSGWQACWRTRADLIVRGLEAYVIDAVGEKVCLARLRGASHPSSAMHARTDAGADTDRDGSGDGETPAKMQTSNVHSRHEKGDLPLLRADGIPRPDDADQGAGMLVHRLNPAAARAAHCLAPADALRPHTLHTLIQQAKVAGKISTTRL